ASPELPSGGWDWPAWPCLSAAEPFCAWRDHLCIGSLWQSWTARWCPAPRSSSSAKLVQNDLVTRTPSGISRFVVDAWRSLLTLVLLACHEVLFCGAIRLDVPDPLPSDESFVALAP